MIDKLRQEVMRRGMKLMTNPKVMKLMADPRVMNAVMKGFAVKGQVQSQLEEQARKVAAALNLVTREDLDNLRRSLSQVEQSVSNLEEQVTTGPKTTV